MAKVNLEVAAPSPAHARQTIESRTPASLAEQFLSTRRYSEQICEPLSIEDYGLQAMASTSPAKWHLAHTTWFFETFILKPYSPNYRLFDERFEYLFNSYYNAIGEQYPRERRGLLSRPTVEQVYDYRQHVNEAMGGLLAGLLPGTADEVLQRTELGCQHEQQHQELFFTDLKYCWFQNPVFPAHSTSSMPAAAAAKAIKWQSVRGDLRSIGHNSDTDFCFDNELPLHRHYVESFQLADRLVTNGEYLAFIADGGYARPELWLADGWAALTGEKSAAGSPLYWLKQDDQWWEYTLHGLVPLDSGRPVCHLSAYEADAYARWAGCRLPTEFEWEVAAIAMEASQTQSSLETGTRVHPTSTAPVGNLWQWTSSAYAPYPGFQAAHGAIGEYNGKFMANQLVLRGGSIVTSPGHYRPSYRNFFYPPDQWQFTGVRLARNS